MLHTYCGKWDDQKEQKSPEHYEKHSSPFNFTNTGLNISNRSSPRFWDSINVIQ